MMKIHLDLTHPAHCWFFLHAYRLLQCTDDFSVTSRDKEINEYLIRHLGYGFLPLRTFFIKSIPLEFLNREIKFLRSVPCKTVDLFTAIGGTWSAHAAFLYRKKCIVWTDTEFARLANRITFPFATAIMTPSCYWHAFPKQVRYRGYHELAYLHPSRFSPDGNIPVHYGLHAPYSIVRFVGWGASHDVREHGFTLENKKRVVRRLLKFGDVLISSEGALPGELARYQSKIDPVDMHHVLAHAQMLVGESATMASEASVLGVPSIFVATTGRGYTDEQEGRYGLTKNFKDQDQEQVFGYIDRILSDEETPGKWQARRTRMLREKIDVTDYMIRLFKETDHTLAGIREFSVRYHKERGLS